MQNDALWGKKRGLDVNNKKAMAPLVTLLIVLLSLTAIPFAAIQYSDEANNNYPTEPQSIDYSPPTIVDRGTVINVTTTADTIDGDTSNVTNLLNNPGSDGLSLREAITATNNNPGVYTIRFAPTLNGSTINIGSQILPPLLSGNVTINGDINFDNKPDVTIAGNGDIFPIVPYAGFEIFSSGNILHAIKIQGFAAGVFFSARGTNVAISDNLICNLEMPGVGVGVLLCGHLYADFRTNNTWSNIQIFNNIITYVQNGVSFALTSAGDSLINTKIVNNTLLVNKGYDSYSNGVSIGCGSAEYSIDDSNSVYDTLVMNNSIESQNSGVDIGIWSSEANIIAHTSIINNEIYGLESDCLGNGIAFLSGFWVDSVNNKILDSVIMNNTVRGSPLNGINICAAAVGAGNNTIDNATIIANDIKLAPKPDGQFGMSSPFGITLMGGDGGSDHHDPSYSPVTPSNNNLLTNIFVGNNRVSNATASGIIVVGGWHGENYTKGDNYNRIDNITLAGNNLIDIGVISMGYVADGITISGGGDFNSISHVTVDSNIIHVRPYDFFHVEGAIRIIGGSTGSDGNALSDIIIANNNIDDSKNVAIIIIGGVGSGGYSWAETVNNTVTNINILQNNLTICQQDGEPDASINIIGGTEGAIGNLVEDIQINQNFAGNEQNVFSVSPNHRESSSNLVNNVTLTYRYLFDINQTSFPVKVYTNSSIATTSFNQNNKTLTLMLNDYLDGCGFANVSFSKSLVGNNPLVTADGNPIQFTLTHNSTHYSVYANYPAGTENLLIAESPPPIPETPTFGVLSLLLAFGAVLIVTAKKYSQKKRHGHDGLIVT
jgi:hypothetical protein